MPAHLLTRKTLEESISAVYEISSTNDEAEHLSHFPRLGLFALSGNEEHLDETKGGKYSLCRSHCLMLALGTHLHFVESHFQQQR